MGQQWSGIYPLGQAETAEIYHSLRRGNGPEKRCLQELHCHVPDYWPLEAMSAQFCLHSEIWNLVQVGSYQNPGIIRIS